MMYHKIVLEDCLSVATAEEMFRLSHITDLALVKKLANKWCDKNGYRLGGYLGSDAWDATGKEE